jgi:hypothetical protein
VQPAEHVGFGVGLPHVHLEAELDAAALAEGDELGVGRGAVDLGFTGPEPRQVGSVEHQHLHDGSSSAA